MTSSAQMSIDGRPYCLRCKRPMQSGGARQWKCNGCGVTSCRRFKYRKEARPRLPAGGEANAHCVKCRRPMRSVKRHTAWECRRCNLHCGKHKISAPKFKCSGCAGYNIIKSNYEAGVRFCTKACRGHVRQLAAEGLAPLRRRQGLASSERSEKLRAWWLKRQYDLTPERYAEMLREQGDACAICKHQPGEEGKKLVVDHSHTTGKVRGLLCPTCNSAIGYLKDSPALAFAAGEYLRASAAEAVKSPS